MNDTLEAEADKITALERENFDLKMKVYYFQNKATVDSNNGGMESPKPAAINQQQLAEIAQLKETNRIIRCQMTDIQADNVQLRLRLTAAQAQAVVDSSNVSAANGGGSTLEKQMNHIEENRRKEKEATTLLLEHDEQVIRQLNEELMELRKKHAQDAEIIGDCAERSITLTETLTERETLIIELNERNQSLQKQVDSLKDQLRRQDILLVKKYTEEERLAYGIQQQVGSNSYGHGSAQFSTTSSLAPPFSSIAISPQQSQSANPYSHTVQYPPTGSASGGGGPYAASQLQSPEYTGVTPLSPVTTMKQNQLENLLFNFTPAPDANSHNNDNNGHNNNNTSDNNASNNNNSLTLMGSPDFRRLSLNQSLGSPQASNSPNNRNNNNNNNSNNIINSNNNSTLTRNSFVGFSAQTAWEELHSLRKEKALLIKSLQENQVKLIDTVEAHEKENKLQEDTLVIAAEEIDRLEKELARMTKRHEKSTMRYKSAEKSLGLLRVRVAELQTQRDELFLKKDLDTALQLSSYRADASRAKVSRRNSIATMSTSTNSVVGGVGGEGGEMGGGLSTKSVVPAGNSAAPAAVTRRMSIGSTMFNFRDVGAASGLKSPTLASGAATAEDAATSTNVVSLEVYQSAIDLYKKRESELLAALEGVVKRCQELESESKSQPHKSLTY